jgi:hypothetical protein
MSEIGHTSLNAPRPKKFKWAGVVASAGIVLGYFVLRWINTRTTLCTTRGLEWLLLLLSLGSFIASVVAAIKHSWWWMIAVFAAILLILQWGGTYEGC